VERRTSGSPTVTLLLSIQHSGLPVVNLMVALFVGLPFLAPILLALGQDGAATAIYAAYEVVCHQWAFRSYFLFGPHPEYGHGTLSALVGPDAVYHFVGSPELGYKVAFCQRDVAIYLAVLTAGLAYGRYRDRLPTLGLAAYALLILPMAVDGLTQLFGWRESTVELRTLTGALFGVASVWLIYPRVDAIFERDIGSIRATASTSAGPA
jgi:uncharacterized membrane protein